MKVDSRIRCAPLAARRAANRVLAHDLLPEKRARQAGDWCTLNHVPLATETGARARLVLAFLCAIIHGAPTRMRLRKIRLAGFKSFVDPTTISFPGDLVGVVGPNGCGKSNVIDAVRWVMGEISAKHLRGDTMADVVFTGSNTRAPVSQASVELLFDNSEGRVGGALAAYGEISIKREVGREGHSAYFLNGARCRRRDVMDVFLGTGLGPRSYAIIEQGMISRVVEARPEDLRDFLEEAAGISKYKERRRETENRMRHTQENLDRLTDLREELGRRLTHLKRQATMAERYKVLKEEERGIRSETEALRWRDLDRQATESQQRIAVQETRMEAALAEQRALESRIEKARTAQAEVTEAFNTVYRQVLEAGAAIARSEETIQNLRARREQLGGAGERERERLEAAHAQARSEEQRLQDLKATLARSEPELETLQQRSSEARRVFREAEEAYLDWQNEGESLNLKAAEPARTKHAEEARIEQLDQNLQSMTRQLESLRGRPAAESGADVTALRALDDEMLGATRSMEEAQAALASREQAVRELREQSHRQSGRLHEARDRLQAMRGRLSSLEALQQAALGKDRSAVGQWLAHHGLADAPRLAERLQVMPGYEAAVESVLDDALEAIQVDDLAAVSAALGASAARAPGGGLGFVEPGASRHTGARADLEPLAVRVSGAGVASLLAGTYLASSLDSALTGRGRLQPGERFVTRDGIQVGRDWLRVPGRDTAQAGVIAREREIHDTSRELAQLDEKVAAVLAEVEATSRALHGAEEQAALARTALAQVQEARAGVQSRLGETRARREQAERREAERQQHIQELEGRLAAERQVQARARERLHASDAQMQRLSGEREQWEQRRDERRRLMEHNRDAWHQVRDETYELGLKVESVRAQAASLQENQGRSRDLIAQLEQRVTELDGELQGLAGPLEEAGAALQTRLASRREVEQTLETVRAKVETAEASLKGLEESRQSAERRVGAERESLDGLRMGSQEILVRRKTIEEQLARLECSPEALLQGLDETASVESWGQRLEEIDRRVTRLGPINLAAIEEYDQQSERKDYLDAQHADLDEALATLTAAIQKIDRETRTRFKETYEKVNVGLQRIFPTLFGGGHAELQMTGEDLLTTGITVTARPPGKRNTNIHLLSGGEKALTAVALVFSIFELNPAPFCLLDEVDAPLDDTNVARFCDLVKSMSEQVQFLIVTHNKITMEIAQQLIGVTMHEPGVSRLVAVDIDEAVEMAAA
jgi:chromosome segregation protein